VARRAGFVGPRWLLVVGWRDTFNAGSVARIGADRDGDYDRCCGTRAGDCDGCTAASTRTDDGGGAAGGEWTCVVPLAVGQYQLQPVDPWGRDLSPLRSCRTFLDDSTPSELSYELG
jgi:hypothetical protein